MSLESLIIPAPVIKSNNNIEKNINKIIFLDVDFVLNTRKSLTKDGLFSLDKECLNNLFYIIEKTGAKIVLSSTWRLYNEHKKFLNDHGIFWIDVTPTHNYSEYCATRAVEIKTWLTINNYKGKFVILDDAEIENELWEFHVQTDDMGEYGLTKELARTAISYLED